MHHVVDLHVVMVTGIDDLRVLDVHCGHRQVGSWEQGRRSGLHLTSIMAHLTDHGETMKTIRDKNKINIYPWDERPYTCKTVKPQAKTLKAFLAPRQLQVCDVLPDSLQGSTDRSIH